MVPRPIEGSGHIVTASTISSSTRMSPSGLFTSIFQHFRPSGLEKQPQPSMARSDPFSELESVSVPSSPPSSSSSGSSPSSSPIFSSSQLPDDSPFASPSTSASTLRSRSRRQKSSSTAISATSRRNKESHRKSTTRRGQISKENVEDLQDTISIARYLIPGYPDTSYTIAPSPSTSASSNSSFSKPWNSHHSEDSWTPEPPENSFLTVILVVVISSITFIWSLAKSYSISGSHYLSQASSTVAHSWRSWRAGYRIRRIPTTPSRKSKAPLRTKFARWFKSLISNPPPPTPIWPPPHLVQTSNRNRTSNTSSHPNAVAGPSTLSTSTPTPIPRGRGVRRTAQIEHVPPPPPPKSMAKPPMKHWQRRRPLASSGSTINHPSSLSSSSSTQGPSSSSSASRLAKIDLQVQVARGMMKSAFQKFREMFQYEVLDAEEIYENPRKPDGADDGVHLIGVKGTNHVLEMDVRQPTIVTHRLYWQGESESVPEALSLALESLLSHLTISNCELALQDVAAILSLCPSLETLEVRQVTQNAKPIAQLSSQADATRSRPHPLLSLAITSRTRLETLFDEIQFTALQSVSFRLYGDGKWTNFEFLATLPRTLQTLRLRGDFQPAEQSIIKSEALKRGSGLQLDLAPVYDTR